MDVGWQSGRGRKIAKFSNQPDFFIEKFKLHLIQIAIYEIVVNRNKNLLLCVPDSFCFIFIER